MVSAASRMSSAISFGVFCRLAPSTSAIIRSRKASPGLAVTSTTIQSDRTWVPPVTELRSPPASRITGALSPVIAASLTEAMPSTTVAVGGDEVARLHQHQVALAQRRGRDDVEVVRRRSGCGSRLACRSRRALRREAACALPRPSAMASAKFANSTVNHSQTDTAEDEPARRFPRADQRLDPEEGREDGADVDHEHHRVPHLALDRQLAERIADRLPDDPGVEERCAPGHRAGHVCRSLLRRDQGEVLDDRARAPAPARTSARRPGSPRRPAARRRAGCGSAACRAPSGTIFFAGQRARDGEHRHREPVPPEEHARPSAVL